MYETETNDVMIGRWLQDGGWRQAASGTTIPLSIQITKLNLIRCVQNWSGGTIRV